MSTRALSTGLSSAAHEAPGTVDDRCESLEASVRDLRRQVASLEWRVAAVEHGQPAETVTADDRTLETPLPSVRAADAALVLAAIGRSFVVLGGAFLLRAITDANVVPHSVGVATGLVYGLFWLWMADRSAPAGRLTATFHGLLAAIIGFPLLWEATVRFAVLSPLQTSLALALIVAGLVLVSLRRHLQWIAWIAVVGAMTSAIALVAATAVLLPFAIVMVGLGITTLWIGYGYDWTQLRWPVAFVADLLVVGLTMRATAPSGLESPFAAVAVQMLLVNAYVASIAVRTLIRARIVNAFEVVQTVAAVAVGFGGAVYIAQVTGAGVLPLAIVTFGAGLACYAVAWVFVATRQGLNRNFYFYTSLALVLIMVSTGLVLDAAPVAAAWTGFALVATLGARGSGRAALGWHGVLYLGGACAISGAVAAAADALVGSAAVAWRPFTPIAHLVTIAALSCWVIAAPADRGVGGVAVPRAVLASLAIWTVGGAVIALAVSPLCGTPGAGADAGAIATVRTTVIALSALGLAAVAQHGHVREAAWLLYMLLAAGAAKLLVEDLPRSKPATLFVALAFYGSALIAASRLGRHRVAPDADHALAHGRAMNRH